MDCLQTHRNRSDLKRLYAGANHYLLVDGVKMEPVQQWIYQTFDNPDWYPLYKNTRYQDVVDLSPCLVQIPSDASIDHQFQQTLGPQGCAISIRSWLETEALGARLSRLLWVYTERGQYLHYRFYDPLSLSRLVPELEPEARFNLFGEIEEIEWFNTEQQMWQLLTLPPTANDSCDAVPVFKNEWVAAISAG